ncbi:MAG: Rv3235 family protein [Nitriliruptor sp.]
MTSTCGPEPTPPREPQDGEGSGATIIALPVRGRPARTTARRPTTPRPSRGPDPARFVAMLVRASSEVAAGRRPLAQLEPVLAPTLLRRLAVQLRGARLEELPEVRRVLVAAPTPSGAVEATALIETCGRVTALAVRLERHHGAWRATELTAPESGFAPLRTRSDPLVGTGPDAFDEAAAEAAALEKVSPRRGSA